MSPNKGELRHTTFRQTPPDSEKSTAFLHVARSATPISPKPSNLCNLFDPMAVLNRLLSRCRPSSSYSVVRRFTAPSDAAVSPKGRAIQWVFLGCPGVGKGTYAARLSALLGVPHISTGDLVRHELSSHGPLSSQLAEIVNQGKLISDETIIDLLSKRLEAGEAKGESGFLLDGFPRTIRQALREEALLAKCLGRRICSECGGNYNVACIEIKGEDGGPDMYMPPLLPPPNCESKLITRADDTEEVVKQRLRIYNETSRPVEEFYRTRGKLLEFELPGGIPESWPKLLQALNLADHEHKKSLAA